MTLSIRAFPLLCIALLLGSCATTEVDVDHSFDPAAQFSEYRSFSVQPVAVPEWDEAHTRILGTNGVALDFAKAVLKEKGYRHVEDGDADFLVTARAAAVSSKQEPPAIDLERPALTFSWDLTPPPQQSSSEYQRESQSESAVHRAKIEAAGYLQYYLVIEIVDVPTSSVVWLGWGRHSSLKSFKDDAYKGEIVSKILTRFPN